MLHALQNIELSWKEELQWEIEKLYFKNLITFLASEQQKHVIYPPTEYIFNAYNSTPFDKIKVVILGQDPYHGYGQAHGLCFSVPLGIKAPPSLVNIFKELKSDIGMSIPNHGNLHTWTQEGVFLLNATLTVRADQAGSHQRKGWENFTDAAIRKLSENRENLVFLLWGAYAHKKENLINVKKHLVLKTVHPSPLSAYAGFFGSKHFSLTNEYLEKNGIEKVRWEL